MEWRDQLDMANVEIAAALSPDLLPVDIIEHVREAIRHLRNVIELLEGDD